MEELKKTAVSEEEIKQAEVAITPVVEKPVAAEPVATEPVAAEPVAAEPVAAKAPEAEAKATGLVRNNRKVREGIVTSNKMNKTIVVAVRDKVKHPLYKKTINKTTKFKAHDENNDCNIGDIVRITETRPISKDKRWRLVKIIERAK